MEPTYKCCYFFFLKSANLGLCSYYGIKQKVSIVRQRDTQAHAYIYYILYYYSNFLILPIQNHWRSTGRRDSYGPIYVY